MTLLPTALALALLNNLEDVNDAGTVDNGTTTPFTFSGGFTSSGGGRYELDLTNYVGGAVFAAYPSSGGLLMLEMDTTLNAGVTGGIAAVQQSGATVAANQGYGLNMAGEDLVNFVEFDDIAEFKTTTSGMTGIVDDNDAGNVGTGSLNGNYTLGSNGFGSATFSQSGGFASMFFYSVDDSLSLAISTDTGSAAVGSFELQVAPTSNAHLAVGRAHSLPMSHVLLRTKRTSKSNRSIVKKGN